MDNKTYNTEVGRVISDALISASMSARQLAQLSGIPSTTLHRKLAGFSSFTVAELTGIAQVLQIPPADILRSADLRAA